MTSADADALQAMLTHHFALAAGVARRVTALRAAVEADDRYEAAAVELVVYLGKEVLPHALAEEHTLYRTAATKEDLAKPVARMVDEHRKLTSLAERLATADNGTTAAAVAEAIGVLFAGHVTEENELLLSPLAADPTVDLDGLLVKMRRFTEVAQDEPPHPEELATPDTEATLTRLLLRAAAQLADVGQGDAACRLAAETWAAVLVARPELAGRVTVVLHRLVSSATTEPVTLLPRRPEGGSADAVLDVRVLAPAERHARIFAAYGALGAGTAFVLVNDHDPRPLRYQFDAQHAGRYSWDYLEAGPEVWRVRIGRPAGTQA